MTESVNFLVPYHYDTSADQRAVNMREIERVINDIIVGNITIAGTSVTPVWTTWNPTITASTGTITTASGSGRYITIDGTTFFTLEIIVTTNGTGAGELRFDLPGTCNPPVCIGSGSETALTDDAVILQAVSSTLISVLFYNGNYPGADGASFYVSGFYEEV